MRQNLLDGDVDVSNVFVLEGSNVGLVNRGNKQVLEVLVRYFLIGIKGRVNVIFPENVCNLCCCQSLRNDRKWARIGRWNEDNVGLSVVDCRGDG